MIPELIAILSVGIAGFVGLAGLMLTLFTRIERRIGRLEDRMGNRMDGMESRMQTLEQGQAELKGALDVIRDFLLQRTAS
jgi:hypothetical protein